jgi:hypothetical protein
VHGELQVPKLPVDLSARCQREGGSVDRVRVAEEVRAFTTDLTTIDWYRTQMPNGGGVLDLLRCCLHLSGSEVCVCVLGVRGRVVAGQHPYH